MKKKLLIIISTIVLLITILWFGEIIPKQIGKIYGTRYMKHNFPEMQLDYINIEWNKYYGNYIITFKDKENQSYSCAIGPKYFPISMGQGLFEIEDIYSKKYKESTLIKQNIAVATFIIGKNNNQESISSENITIDSKLVNTFKTLINSNVIQNKIKDKYPNAGNIELEVIADTGILKAIYVCDNYSNQECIEILNKYVEIFSDRVVEIYNIDSVSILESANISTRLIEKE